MQANGADIRGGTWFETGAEMLNGGTLNYFAVPWGIINNPLPLVVVTLIEVGLLGAAEKYRCAAFTLLPRPMICLPCRHMPMRVQALSVRALSVMVGAPL